MSIDILLPRLTLNYIRFELFQICPYKICNTKFNGANPNQFEDNAKGLRIHSNRTTLGSGCPFAKSTSTL